MPNPSEIERCCPHHCTAPDCDCMRGRVKLTVHKKDDRSLDALIRDEQEATRKKKEQGDIDVATCEPEAYVPKTDFGRRLLALRDAAIKDGMKLMTVDEILQEIRDRRGDSDVYAGLSDQEGDQQ